MHFTRALAILAVVLPVVFAQDGGDLQSSLSLSPDLVQPGSNQDGQEDTPTDGQVRSKTSGNNFINFCATKPNQPLTNGEQIFGGSCNGIPMGEIMAKSKMPSAKVFFPQNGAKVAEGQDINFQVKVRNIQTGSFTNAQATYYSSPAELNGDGILIGHQHITVDEIPSLDDNEPRDIQDFAFFKGLNNPADGNGVLSAVAPGGLAAGFYRACTMGSSSNHAPIIPPVAQRASGEDCIRFEVVAAGGGGGGNQDQGNQDAGAAGGQNQDAGAAGGQNQDAGAGAGGGQNQDGQNQDGQNQDGQNQDGQNQDGQNQDGQNQDGQNQDGQNQDGQNQDAGAAGDAPAADAPAADAPAADAPAADAPAADAPAADAPAADAPAADAPAVPTRGGGRGRGGRRPQFTTPFQRPANGKRTSNLSRRQFSAAGRSRLSRK